MVQPFGSGFHRKGHPKGEILAGLPRPPPYSTAEPFPPGKPGFKKPGGFFCLHGLVKPSWDKKFFLHCPPEGNFLLKRERSLPFQRTKMRMAALKWGIPKGKAVLAPAGAALFRPVYGKESALDG
jgi:hypothetical protein